MFIVIYLPTKGEEESMVRILQVLRFARNPLALLKISELYKSLTENYVEMEASVVSLELKAGYVSPLSRILFVSAVQVVSLQFE